MRVIFFGTPIFAANILEYLLRNQIDIVAVVTKPDRPQGRSGELIPPPVKLIALDQGLPLYQPEIVSAIDFAPVLSHYQADLFVVVAYGEILKQHLLDMPKLGCINVHASLLPKYRGAAPIQQCIINGEVQTGITIMHMTKKMDAGDIIEAVKVPIGPDTSYGELEEELCQEGKKALLNVIHDFEKGIIKRIPQDHTQATYSSKIESQHCQIDWAQPAEKLHNLIRGVNPHPGAWCYVYCKDQKKRLKVFRTKVAKNISALPGTILSDGKKELLIACGKDALSLIELQLEGKKIMNPEELLRGLSQENLSFI